MVMRLMEELVITTRNILISRCGLVQWTKNGQLYSSWNTFTPNYYSHFQFSTIPTQFSGVTPFYAKSSTRGWTSLHCPTIKVDASAITYLSLL